MSSRFSLALALAAAASLAPSLARAQCSELTPIINLSDSGGFVWDVTPRGAIGNGSSDAYDGAFFLAINGTYFASTSAAASELAGRQVVTQAVTVAGLSVQRRIYVPTTAQWARFYDSFTNSTGAPITVTVRSESNAGSDAGSVITGSSSGDNLFSTADRWVANDDSSDGGGDPSTAYVLWGDGGRVRPTAVSTTVFDCAAANGYSADFSITVPAGGTVALMFFGVQANNRASSVTLARSFDTLPDAALTGLTPTQRAAIANWAVCGDTDADGDGQSCAAGDCNDGDRTIFSGAPERCNMRDDNCNNMADEGLNVGGSCVGGVGACARTGTRSCTADGSVLCSAMPGTPTTELCGDMIDNDCDGMTDEGFDVGMACTVGLGVCARTAARACSADRTGTVCAATPGTASPERCDGMDNDCDGATDEDFDVGMACAAGNGACRATGMRVCNADGTATVCSATVGTPAPEVCDGVDNDCNGMIDDGASICGASADGAQCVSVGTTTACGCADDRDCGGAMSGRTCDPMLRRCVAGCVEAQGRNGCPAGMFCTSQDPTRIGFCSMNCTIDAHCAAMSPRARCLAADAGLGRCVECTGDAQCTDRGDGRARCIDNACAQCSAAQREVCTAAGPGAACLPSGLCGCSTDGDCANGRRCEMGRCAQTVADAGASDAGSTDAGSTDAAIATTDLGSDAGGSVTPDDGGRVETFGGRAGGCGCRTTTPSRLGTAWIALAALALVRRRRRR